MDNEKMIKLLDNIEVLIKQDSLDLAKEMTKLEIENLKGITEKICKDTKYYYYDWYCQHCSNFNCNSNKN